MAKRSAGGASNTAKQLVRQLRGADKQFLKTLKDRGDIKRDDIIAIARAVNSGTPFQDAVANVAPNVTLPMGFNRKVPQTQPGNGSHAAETLEMPPPPRYDPDIAKLETIEVPSPPKNGNGRNGGNGTPELSAIDMGDLGIVEDISPTIQAQRIPESDQIIAPHDQATKTMTGYRPVPQSPAISDITGKYTKKKELGKGGMGSVALAAEHFMSVDQKTVMDRDVALKRPHYAPDANKQVILGRFLREAEAMTQLNHPNIPKIYGLYEEAQDEWVMAMQVVPGRDLTDLLRTDQAYISSLRKKRKTTQNDQERALLQATLDVIQLPPAEYRAELLRHFLDVCEAVDYMHQKGFIHRDLKPDNVRVGENNEVFLMDYGLAKRVGELEEIVDEPGSQQDVELTRQGATLGTPMYMSPEQAGGGELTPASDIYALGCVLQHLVTGKKPNSAPKNSMLELLLRISENDFPLPSEQADVPPELESIILKARAKETEDRYASAKELHLDVRNFIEGKEVQAHNYNTLGKYKLWEKKHPRQSIGYKLSTAALALTLIVGGHFKTKADRAELEGRIHAEQVQREAAEERNALMQREMRAAEIIDLGDDDMRRGHYANAIEDYDRVINDPELQESGELAEAYFNRGLARYELLDGNAAIPDFERANELDGDGNAAALFYASLVSLDLKLNMNEAARFAEQIREMDLPPNNGYKILAESILAFRDRNVDRAMETAEAAAEQDYWEGMYLLAGYHTYGVPGPFHVSELQQHRNLNSAVELLDQALASEPGQVRCIYTRSIVQGSRGHFENALQDAERLVRANPEVGEFYTLRAAFHAELGQLNRAQEDLALAERYDGVNSTHIQVRGVIQLQEGHYEAAEQTYRNAIDRYGPTHITLTQVAQAHFFQNEFDDARENLARSLELNPDYAKAHNLLGGIIANDTSTGLPLNDRLLQALGSFERAAELGWAEAHYNLGLAYDRLGREADARRAMNAYLGSNHQDEQMRRQAQEMLGNY